MRFTPLPKKQVKILAIKSSAIKLGELTKQNEHEELILVLTKKGSAYTLYQRQPMLKGQGFRDFERGDIYKMAFLTAICGGGIDTADLEMLAGGEQAALYLPADPTYKRRFQDAEKAASAMKVAEYDFAAKHMKRQ